MYLRSISMKGFKSFPERTELAFTRGVSVIVGPNGSGKSNVTDAVLWALGEQSPAAIRGVSMQDMISVGGSGVGARSSAEVEVVIDNSDGRAATDLSEIAVTRRLDRSGDGEYRLNGARCRLVDILEVLSDTNLGREMHSVISQGRVEAIVNSKPKDRRMLIEEAAGLGKHRKRRRRSELKLKATRENLDRALDIEREARRGLRPLKQQAQAAEIGARIEKQELGLKSKLIAEELRFGESRLETARKQAEAARGQRDGLERELAAVSERRARAERRFAERDRHRTETWSLLTSLREGQQRIAIAATKLADRGIALEAALERLRAELAPLTLEVDPAGGATERARRLAEELSEVEAGLESATEALGRARGEGDEEARLAALSGVGDGAERAGRHARRAEGLLGEDQRERLRRRREGVEAALAALRSVEAVLAEAGRQVSERVARAERTVIGGDGDGDEIADELKLCSKLEAEAQAKMRSIAERVTKAEVEAAHLGDRRSEAAEELARIAERLGEEVPEAERPMSDEERAGIEAGLNRLGRRRERLGPVNPLAEREYEEARERLEELIAQREDTERAMRELESVIRDIDDEIRRSFEQTFEATSANFEEMISHLFPGGRGRLRPVSLRVVPPPADDGGGEGDGDGSEDGEDDGGPEEAERRAEMGVEIEVTPGGKTMRKLSLLSGGEKSLVALAFVFAVFLARPCPFYILDEVEAALDDANIDRFLQLIRRFSDRAQFIIVTHQKRTMDAADVLYGVSMGGDGVTKVISRRLPRDVEPPAGVELEAA